METTAHLFLSLTSISHYSNGYESGLTFIEHKAQSFLRKKVKKVSFSCIKQLENIHPNEQDGDHMFMKHIIVSVSIFAVMFISAYMLNHTTKRSFYEEMFIRPVNYEQMTSIITRTESVFQSREYVRIGVIMSPVSEIQEETDEL